MRQRGFTLVEVMLALSILFASLVVLVSRTAANIRLTQESHSIDIATELARSKMYDIEEILLDEGFQELDKSLEDDFDEEGWPRYHWKAEIIKIELPALGALEALDEDGNPTGEGGEGGGMMNSPLVGMLGGMGGGMGGAGDSEGGMGGMGASFIASQFELISQILEASIRKVTLTVYWTVNGDDEELSVVCYFTDPAAINRVISGGSGYVDPDDGSGGDAGGGGSGGDEGGSPPRVTPGRSRGGGAKR